MKHWLSMLRGLLHVLSTTKFDWVWFHLPSGGSPSTSIQEENFISVQIPIFSPPSGMICVKMILLKLSSALSEKTILSAGLTEFEL